VGFIPLGVLPFGAGISCLLYLSISQTTIP